MSHVDGGVQQQQQQQQHAALARLELETAGSAMDALEDSLESVSWSLEEDEESDAASAAGGQSGSGGGGGGSGVPSPRALLQRLCMDIIISGGASLTQALQTRLGSRGASVLVSAASSSRAGRDGGGDGSEVGAGVHVAASWLDALRAPLVARALLMAAHLPGAAERRLVRALFPHLLVLMCSHQVVVREAVAVYFRKAVGPHIMGSGAGTERLN
jgi:hypothetical protein